MIVVMLARLSAHRKLITAVLGVGVLVGGVIYACSLFQPVSIQAQPTTFVIPRSQAVDIIARRLYDQGLIKSQLAFRLVLKQTEFEDRLQAGSFQLSPSMNLKDMAQQLTQGTNDLWVTIPEGWRREQIAASLDNQELSAFEVDEFLHLTAGLEGRLFPDTYLFSRESTTQHILQTLLDNFEKKVLMGLDSELAKSEYSLEQILIMASIVEREARGLEEMRHVAGILWHRYQLEMALQVDASLQYINGYSQIGESWWSLPSAADKKIDSLYNTYLYLGLPPRPICNPGLVAIQAALGPLNTQDLYYLHDRSGGIHYTRTLEEHNANVQRYLR